MGGDGISNSSLIDSICIGFVNFSWLTVAIMGGVGVEDDWGCYELEK